MITNDETFETQDLNLSAVLIAKGFSLKDVNKNREGKATFSFKPHPNIFNTIQQYWNHELLLNPQDLFNALKLLKNRIYSNY